MQISSSGLHFLVPKTGNESFNVQLEIGENYYPLRHYHPEIQITLILDGHGMRFIGDSIGNFSKGEIYMIGSSVPHVFKDENSSSPDYYKKRAHSVSVYFKPGAFGETFMNLPETRSISRLLDLASRGLEVTGTTRDLIASGLLQLQESEGFPRMMELLDLLYILSQSDDLISLSSLAYHRPARDSDNLRLSELFEYVTSAYSEKISLNKAASIAHMSPTAFCRYFKQQAGQTFTSFLNRTRIGKASKLLLETDGSVSEIGYACGYNSIPYFTRQFKRYTGMAPLAYRRKLQINQNELMDK